MKKHGTSKRTFKNPDLITVGTPNHREKTLLLPVLMILGFCVIVFVFSTNRPDEKPEEEVAEYKTALATPEIDSDHSDLRPGSIPDAQPAGAPGGEDVIVLTDPSQLDSIDPLDSPAYFVENPEPESKEDLLAGEPAGNEPGSIPGGRNVIEDPLESELIPPSIDAPIIEPPILDQPLWEKKNGSLGMAIGQAALSELGRKTGVDISIYPRSGVEIKIDSNSDREVDLDLSIPFDSIPEIRGSNRRLSQVSEILELIRQAQRFR